MCDFFTMPPFISLLPETILVRIMLPVCLQEFVWKRVVGQRLAKVAIIGGMKHD